MAEVFISYSSADSAKAYEILERLEGAGISCWLSQRDIPPGADYALEIPKAITACSHFVLLLTNAAQNSPYVMLELDRAFKQNKDIIPILLEQVEENEKTNFFLNAKQKLNAVENLAPALNAIIRRIKPDALATITSSNPSPRIKHSQINHINCPYCEEKVLKQINEFSLGGGLYVDEGTIKKMPRGFWRLQSKPLEIMMAILSGVGFGLLIGILILIFILKKMLYTPDQIRLFRLIVVFQIACIVTNIILLLGCHKIRKIKENLLDQSDELDIASKKLCESIQHTKLKYWTLKCAKCEKEFSILLPKEEALDDRVVTLLRDEKSDNSCLQ